MKRLTTYLSLLIFGLLPTFAQGPNGSGTYYQAANGLSGQALKTKLFTIISKKTHSPSYDELLELYKKTDTRADGYVRDWYSNTTKFTHIKDKAGSYQKEGDVYNREHTVPQSWGPPKADIVHVVPTDGYVNNRRSNYPFGEVGNATYTSNNGYCKLGSCKTAGYSGTVFEPNDEVKGDIARIYFYMATCYENEAASWSGAFGGTKYQPMAQWTFDMMVRWSKLDPVDDVERARNNAIAKSDVQGNRNPFVDYPGLEDYIWGSKKNVAFNYTNYEGGGDTPAADVAQPVFSPEGGTFTGSVTVSISTTTTGATIYYTTNGVDASERSHVYDGPITLSETTTLKAIAMKDGEKSYQTIATYTITDDQGQQTPAEGTIALNNVFFGSATGTISSRDNDEDLTGTQDGVTVTYALGSGGQRYCGTDHIRMYGGNKLTVSVAQGTIVGLEFDLKESTTKGWHASTGTVSDYSWSGSAQSVTFHVDDGSGHAKIKSVKVRLAGSDIAVPTVANESQHTVYDLQGRKMRATRKGIYIRDGKKFVIR